MYALIRCPLLDFFFFFIVIYYKFSIEKLKAVIKFNRLGGVCLIRVYRLRKKKKMAISFS